VAVGQFPQDALEILRYRLTDEETDDILPDAWTRVSQRILQDSVDLLG